MRNLIVMLGIALAAQSADAARLKELVEVEGFRTNALTGVGLVVGLQGTGDDSSSLFTRQPLATLLKHLGTVIDPTDIKAKNVALVMVTANLPPFARAGMSLDVTVSSMATAKSLQGGTLLLTQLKGANQETYALAQGSLTLGGFAVESAGSSSKKNQVTVGHIPGGAHIERDGPTALPKSEIVLLLRDPDFTTAMRISEAINRTMGAEETMARVRDPGSVVVAMNGPWQARPVELVATLEAIEATPDLPGRVVIDERTGTLVIGSNVTLLPVSIAHGGITVKVAQEKAVSQPNALARGETAVVAHSTLDVEEKAGQLIPLAGAATVGDLTSALNALGVKPRDLVSILQALKAAGALRATIEIL